MDTSLPPWAEFPGKSVVESFHFAEKTLAEVLAVVPYTTEHFTVWSARLVTVILEACSQLASLWRFCARRWPQLKAKPKPVINDYWEYFRDDVRTKWCVVFAGSKPETLRPFLNWNCAEYESLAWWNAYNKLKHNRLENVKYASI